MSESNLVQLYANANIHIAALERDLTTLRSLAAAMADEMEQHGGEMAFATLARYRAAWQKVRDAYKKDIQS